LEPHSPPLGVHAAVQNPSGLQWNPAGHVFGAPGCGSHSIEHSGAGGS
jgi:hypothetical protein